MAIASTVSLSVVLKSLIQLVSLGGGTFSAPKLVGGGLCLNLRELFFIVPCTLLAKSVTHVSVPLHWLAWKVPAVCLQPQIGLMGRAQGATPRSRSSLHSHSVRDDWGDALCVKGRLSVISHCELSLLVKPVTHNSDVSVSNFTSATSSIVEFPLCSAEVSDPEHYVILSVDKGLIFIGRAVCPFLQYACSYQDV